MALGASTANLLKLVMTQGFAMTLAGVAVGALAALLLTPRVADLLYRVSPRDASVFAAAAVVMLAASGAACFVPAWRAARTDPLKDLR
jgi:ABC-type antimicrobial peptide transport system permease subunit